jgi:hypothetical protein
MRQVASGKTTMKIAKLILATIAVYGTLSAVSAGAFTYDNRTNQSPDAALRLKQNKDGSFGNSHFSMQFSGGSGVGGQSGVQNRFVQSSNPDLANPFNSENNLDLALGNRH